MSNSQRTAGESSPASATIVYDGSCPFCVAGARRLAGLARPGAVRLVSSQDEAALAGLPWLDPGAVARAIQFVDSDGTVSEGVKAIVRALNTRRAWKAVTWLYWVPGLREAADAAYRVVAANRHHLPGDPQRCGPEGCQTKR